ncbi:DMT family transporter [Acinetobacter rathckeae]|uniref:DMT family transporter n=1 Tax=Acinetobacter rathckeae TaxID=2605272 RepID=UPI0018A2BFE7|nr:EamA family transporter [Acinetobacter rathckeae]MBF7687868.1 EamA family transporter [Acinetobacter rathckeae]MBF7687909.1 EamA family transporter [Acinetobacter rathckeae]MBF7696038.1 EamA family transporter [Acinetobacter rathckeae]
MRLFYLVGFSVLMLFDTLAQVSFKLASNHAMPLTFDVPWLLRVFGNVWIYGALIGYIGSFFTWMTLLEKAPIGPAVAASHIELVSVTLLSVWLFNEPLTAFKVCGMALIVIGVLFLAKGEAKIYKQQQQ